LVALMRRGEVWAAVEQAGEGALTIVTATMMMGASGCGHCWRWGEPLLVSLAAVIG
jgi:hypothetical protein